MEKILKTGNVGALGAESRYFYGGMKWVVLESRPNVVLSIASDIVCLMPFDTNKKNDFAAASLRAFLNGDFLEELATAGADKDAFIPIDLDLTSDDGLDDYGTDSVKIGLISDSMYRQFRKIIPSVSNWWWTCTPFCTARNDRYRSFVRLVNISGVLSSNIAYNGNGGVRPLCALKSDILVSYAEDEVNECKPSIGKIFGKAIIEELTKGIINGNGEEPKGILAEAQAQAAHEKEQEKEAKRLFGWYSELKKAGFTDAQAFELIKG